MRCRPLLLLLLILCATDAQKCPPSENIAPLCMCQQFQGFAMMNCQDVTNAESLYSPIRSTVGYDILALNIERSSLQYIPSRLFERTKVSKIRFFESELLSLSDSDLAFEGLENHLEEFRANGASFVATWDWSQLRNHKRLDLIDLSDIIMYSLDNEIPQLNSLKAFGISKAEISFIHPEAFKGLPNLEILVLKQNAISEFHRRMLPMPAEKLVHIDLSSNNLVSLPNDMFDGMPNLRDLILSSNQFTTLTTYPFSGVLLKLLTFELNDNDIRCDCRLRWLVNHRTPLYFNGVCNEPERLRGVSLKYLQFSELWC